MAKVQITDTILRDGHQSQAATRMRTDEMLPACEMLDKVGYYSLECWGGATYDACLRFLNEDPWERLRKLRKALPNTKLQMLLRGQNLLGYRPYADDVVDFFVKKAVENGIDIIRCFDALNDLRNMQTAVKATKKYGGTAEIAMSYTESPVHNEDYFVKLAVDIQKMGADVICIKDMANLLLPYKAYSLVKRLKKETDLPMQTLHQRSVLTFRVADDNIIVRHEERIADLTLCAEGFTGTGSAQNQTVGVLQLFAVNHNQVVGQSVQAIIQAFLAVVEQLLRGKRHKNCRAAGGQTPLDLDLAVCQRQRGHKPLLLLKIKAA